MYKINNILPDEHKYLQITQGIADFPKSLYLLGKLPKAITPTVAIIGTRKPTTYGQDVCYRLAHDLAKRGVVIMSGLALGTDAIAHAAALDAGGTTIAVMPSPLDNICPRTNRALAQRILQHGGALISEYPPGATIYRLNFVARNRLVAAMADGILVIEASAKSGTLHTAAFALDYGRPVMAIPGNISNPMSLGTNNLIKTGARLITSTDDIADEIGLRIPKQVALPIAQNQEESIILRLMTQGVRDGEQLQKQSTLPAPVFNQTMTMLEINGVIRALGGNMWGL